MKLEKAKTLYRGEWIAFRYFDESDNPEGEILIHDKDRRAFDKKLLQQKLTGVYVTFTGQLVPDGYSVLF